MFGGGGGGFQASQGQLENRVFSKEQTSSSTGKIYMCSHSVSIEIAAEHWYPWVTSFGCLGLFAFCELFFKAMVAGALFRLRQATLFLGVWQHRVYGSWTNRPYYTIILYHSTTLYIVYCWCLCDGWKMIQVVFWYSKNRLWHALALSKGSLATLGLLLLIWSSQQLTSARAHARHPCPQHHRPDQQLMVQWPRDSCHWTEIYRTHRVLQLWLLWHIFRKNLVVELSFR